ncbi:MAG: SDR family oxidoreductase [Pseudomonadota bacterium]
MTTQRLEGKRVLLTQADDYMGPATLPLFAEHGAEVIADTSNLTSQAAVEALVERAGPIDILIANLAAPANTGIEATDLSDEDFATMFEVMVYPLHRLCRAILPQMYARGSGKVVVYGSATGLKAMARTSAYTAARTAQVGYVRATGLEAARHNVQINLIAQNYVENPEYYPPELVSTERFQNHLQRNVPLGRLATAREDALFALFLASQDSDFFVGQAIPFSGGWTQ